MFTQNIKSGNSYFPDLISQKNDLFKYDRRDKKYTWCYS